MCAILMHNACNEMCLTLNTVPYTHTPYMTFTKQYIFFLLIVRNASNDRSCFSLFRFDL